MQINYLSFILWFNLYDNHKDLLDILAKELKSEYKTLNYNAPGDNVFEPVIMAINEEERTNLQMSRINIQYNMDLIRDNDIDTFKERVLKLYNILVDNGVDPLYNAVLSGVEVNVDFSTEVLKKLFNKNFQDERVVDLTAKVGSVYDDMYYKIMNISNNKHIKVPQKFDDEGRNIPLPLISFNGCVTEYESVLVGYEINDKYSYDFTKNYRTSEFHLNKMLHLLKDDMLDDISAIVEKGELN